MAKFKVKKGDTVKVLAGESKGSTGRIVRVIPKMNRVVVEGVNMIKKHQKPSATSPQGGIVEMEAPLHISNVSLVDPTSNEVTRVGRKMDDFKLRKGMPIGARVTLRGDQMYEFLDRLISAALPRIRDFQGVKSSGFDGRGNYTFGITEQIIFPEIEIDKVNRITGMDITFVTSASTDKEAKALLTAFGLPLKK